MVCFMYPLMDVKFILAALLCYVSIIVAVVDVLLPDMALFLSSWPRHACACHIYEKEIRNW